MNAVREIVATIASHDCGATTKRLGWGGEDAGSNWMRLDWNTVAIKLAGRYKVATEVSAFITFESLSRSSLRRVSVLASKPKLPNVWETAVLVFCISWLVRKSRILYNYMVRGKVSRKRYSAQREVQD